MGRHWDQADIAILAAAPVFELFGRDALRLLCFAGERRLLGEGDLLFARGEPSDGGYVVMSGTIALVPLRSGADPFNPAPRQRLEPASPPR